MPVLEPSTLLQLALFKETGPRGTRKSVMMGLLRLRLNSLTPDVDHIAELPMCASRKQGGEKTATLGLNVKVCLCSSHPDHLCTGLQSVGRCSSRSLTVRMSLLVLYTSVFDPVTSCLLE